MKMRKQGSVHIRMDPAQKPLARYSQGLWYGHSGWSSVCVCVCVWMVGVADSLEMTEE